jgi:ligand-binding sensor domain-containing protein
VYNAKSFSYLTVNDGLPDNQIHSIQEDKNGIIWLNTQTGVCSFDGSIVTKHTQSSKENAYHAFTYKGNTYNTKEWMKAEGDLWFEAENKLGVYRYDGKQLYYLELPAQKKLNPNDNLFAVTDISSGKNNRVWFATYAGVFGYNGNSFTIITDETLGYDRKIEALHIRSILEDSKGRLWIGNNSIGVLLKEGDSIINFSGKHGLIDANSKRNGSKSPKGTLEHIFTIAEDKSGNIWFGDRDAGIWKYDGKQLKNYTTKDGLVNDFALSIYEDRGGMLWFGMADGSLFKYNGMTFEKHF